VETVTGERDAVRKCHDELRKRRLDEFMAGFNTITMKLKEMYQMITLGGDAELELVDSLDPFRCVRDVSTAWSAANRTHGAMVQAAMQRREAQSSHEPRLTAVVCVGVWGWVVCAAPFGSEGIVFSVRPPKKSWKNISNLSGGEKTLSSLSLVFALHHYKPTPLYVMDEIDAALDFKNVSIVAHYIKERTKNAQFVIISLRNNMFELADRLVRV